jgi:hypothetical protein
MNRYKAAKHFKLDIQAESFNYERNCESIERSAALDGLYVIRTSVEAEVLSPQETVKPYRTHLRSFLDQSGSQVSRLV